MPPSDASPQMKRVMIMRIWAIKVCSGLPATRFDTFEVKAARMRPKPPVTQSRCPARNGWATIMIHAPVMTAIKIGSHHGVHRRKITRAVTLASTKKGVSGWLKTSRAKMSTRLTSRAARCPGRTRVGIVSGALNHSEDPRTTREKRPGLVGTRVVAGMWGKKDTGIFTRPLWPSSTPFVPPEPLAFPVLNKEVKDLRVALCGSNETLKYFNKMAIMTRYKKKLNPCGEK